MNTIAKPHLKKLCDTFELHQFIQQGAYNGQFLYKKKLFLVQAPSLSAKFWFRFWSHSLEQTDFSSDYMGPIQNEPKYAAELKRLFFQTTIPNFQNSA